MYNTTITGTNIYNKLLNRPVSRRDGLFKLAFIQGACVSLSSQPQLVLAEPLQLLHLAVACAVAHQ